MTEVDSKVVDTGSCCQNMRLHNKAELNIKLTGCKEKRTHIDRALILPFRIDNRILLIRYVFKFLSDEEISYIVCLIL